jgi:hypothetical protein
VSDATLREQAGAIEFESRMRFTMNETDHPSVAARARLV